MTWSRQGEDVSEGDVYGLWSACSRIHRYASKLAGAKSIDHRPRSSRIPRVVIYCWPEYNNILH